MIEILFLIWFVRKLAGTAKAKGRAGSWGGLGALFWITGEVIGFLIGGASGSPGAAYGLALFCAAIGAGAAWAIVNALGPSEWAASGGDETGNPHYDPKNPYSPPR